MRLLINALFMMLHFCTVTSLQETKVIQTKTGKVQGEVEPTLFDGKYVQKFRDIPYAEPPVGKLRLAQPQPKKPWSGTRKNSNVTIACVQGLDDPSVKQTEDCLLLNIWTPYPQKQNLSVMIWLHGGGFVLGMANNYIGYNLVAVGDVILVTVNYRVALLGFFTTGDDRIKGNFGLYDQRLAMKWVKENIASFGGNPGSITIFGVSAGGASAAAHTLSEKSWPYFNRAILQSGLVMMPWVMQSKKYIKDALNVFLQHVDCTNDDHLLECLQSNTTDAFLRHIGHLPVELLSVRPWVDGDFLSDKPETLLKKGKVKASAIMLGLTKDEAYFITAQDLLKQTRDVNVLRTRSDAFIKEYFKSSPEAVYKEALKLYNSECAPSFVEAVRPMVDLLSDVRFTCPVVNEVMFRAQLPSSPPIYLYRYSLASAVAMLEFLYHEDTFGFVTHGADIHSTFGDPIKDPHFPAEDQILSMRMILYWTNFAKHGDPNIGTTKLPIVLNSIDSLPKWPKYNTSDEEYLDMENLSRMIVRKRLRGKYCEFHKDPLRFLTAMSLVNGSAPPGGPTSSSQMLQLHMSPVALLIFIMFHVIL